jgi:hypothetical protein
VIDVMGDRLAISHDGGASAQVALQLPEDMSAFLRRADGTLMVATVGHGGWQSHDGGKTFAPWPRAPRLRALAERAGRLYGVGDNFQDRFAVGWSSDDGETWTPLLRFDQICDLAGCAGPASLTCRGPLMRLMALVGGACGMTGPEPLRDAGRDAAVMAAKSGGCACGLSRPATAGWWIVAAIAAALVLGRKRR